MDTPVVAVAQISEVLGDVERGVRDHVRLASVAAQRGARLLVFPELSLTGYSRALTPAEAFASDDSRLDPLRATARQLGITIVAGAPVTSPRGLHIGAIIVGLDGACAIYEKEHLHSGEEVAFAPGRGGPCQPVFGESVGVAICAEVTHPEHARAAASRGATIYAAGCFVTERGYASFEAALQTYAKQHGFLVLMANYAAPTQQYESAGRSAIWSRSGDLIACAGRTGEALVLAHHSSGRWSSEVIS